MDPKNGKPEEAKEIVFICPKCGEVMIAAMGSSIENVLERKEVEQAFQTHEANCKGIYAVMAEQAKRKGRK